MYQENVLLPEKGEKISKKLIYRNDNFESLLLFIPADQILKPHKSDKDAVILVIEGSAEFILEERRQIIGRNDVISFKSGQVHSIKALTDFTFLLVK